MRTTLRLLFADDRGAVYDHARLLAAVRTGDALRPVDGDRTVGLPEGATICTLPGRRPVGVDPMTGELVTLHRATVGRRSFVPTAVGCVLPPGWTRTLLPAFAASALPTVPDAPTLTQWAYTAAAIGPRGPVAFAIRTDRRSHWSAGSHGTPDLRRRVERRIASTDNPVWHQIARCSLEWRCFTAQNTFYGRDEGAIPSSAACNASCIGCLSEQADGMPPSSHERIARPPSAEEMAEVAVDHLSNATGRVIVSFGQGCEGEPLLRWRAIERAIRLTRARTRRGSINVNTNGSLPDALGALVDAGLDACRISLNSASPDLYAAYYRPVGYDLSAVIRSIQVARERGAYVALNLLTFPGVTDRAGEVDGLAELVGRLRVDQVQTRPLAIDPDVYMAVARDRGAGGPALGIPELLRRLREARPGLVIGNFARARGERSAPRRAARRAAR